MWPVNSRAGSVGSVNRDAPHDADRKAVSIHVDSLCIGSRGRQGNVAVTRTALAVVTPCMCNRPFHRPTFHAFVAFWREPRRTFAPRRQCLPRIGLTPGRDRPEYARVRALDVWTGRKQCRG